MEPVDSIISHHKNINVQYCQRHLSGKIRPVAAELFPSISAIFGDNSVSIHTAKVFAKWHEEHCSEDEHLIWRLWSTDLNIIEYVYNILEIQVIRRYLLSSLLQEPGIVLAEEWAKIHLGKRVHTS